MSSGRSPSSRCRPIAGASSCRSRRAMPAAAWSDLRVTARSASGMIKTVNFYSAHRAALPPVPAARERRRLTTAEPLRIDVGLKAGDAVPNAEHRPVELSISPSTPLPPGVTARVSPRRYPDGAGLAGPDGLATLQLGRPTGRSASRCVRRFAAPPRRPARPRRACNRSSRSPSTWTCRTASPGSSSATTSPTAPVNPTSSASALQSDEPPGGRLARRRDGSASTSRATTDDLRPFAAAWSTSGFGLTAPALSV